MITSFGFRKWLAGLLGLVAFVVVCGLAPGARAAGCTLDHATEQACGVAASARAGQATSLTVADYEDLSHCAFAPSPTEPGDNGRYVVAVVRVSWGDGTGSKTGKALVGTGCAGSNSDDETGEKEPVTGKHTYRKPGTYNVKVLIIYRRAAGNTYENCATVKGGAVYNKRSNCVALGGVVSSTVTVKP